MRLEGIERVQKLILEQVGKVFLDNDINPLTLDAYRDFQKIINSASIGQLLTFSRLGNRAKGLKLFSIDKEGTIYLEISGLYGGMDLEGNIHT